MTLPLRSVAVIALALVAVPAAAQDLEPVPFPPYDPEWRPRLYPEYNCDELPLHAPDPRELGLAEALAAVERRELSTNGLGDALSWAERAADPALIPVLKRIVEGYRCADNHVETAFLAIEAAGEPSEYFLRYALDWATDDALATRAMTALAVRGDSSVYGELRASVMGAPDTGPRGRSVQSEFNNGYLGRVGARAVIASLPFPERLRRAAESGVGAAPASIIVSGPDGPVLSQFTYASNAAASYRRDLRRLGQSHPSAVAAALEAYEDSARVGLAERGIAPEHVELFLREVRLQSSEIAFPAVDSPPPPPTTSAQIRLGVCTEDRSGEPGYRDGVLAAAFTYTSEEADAVRVPYGAANRFAGPWSAADSPFQPAPPEVFFPGAVGWERALRVRLQAGETAVWTLLGRSVAAGEASPRCDGTDPLLLGALPAALVATGGPAAFRGNAFVVSGAAHALDGAPTGGPGASALAAPTDDALAAVLGALSGRQRARLDGPAEAAPLVISPDSWADHLIDRATATLGDRPASVGSASAPVVAYAPEGARLDGSFEGVGVLVVDGPLAMRGNARWTGLVIARDGLDVSGSASVVGGAVVSGQLAVGGSAGVLYSPAALALARAAAVAD